MINFIKKQLSDNIAMPLFEKKKIDIGIKTLKQNKEFKKNNKVAAKNFTINSFGKKNSNKIFYIINRSPGAGLFSNVTFVLNHLSICKIFNFIPVIDMENFPTIYNEKKKINKTLNAWHYYFKPLNNHNLKEVYKSKNVIFCDNNFHGNMINDMTDNKLRFFFNKIKINSKFVKQSNYLYNNFFDKKDKVLGLHFRGSTYKVARGHAFPPTTNLMIKNINYLMKKYKYNKIFLVTEEQKYLNILKKKYSDKCLYLNNYRMNKIDSFKVYPRSKHRYKLGKEILLDTLMLSKCNGLSYIKSNVISAAKLLAKIKQNDHELFFGYNSRNKFIARWLWYLKLFFPFIFGKIKQIKK